MIPLERLENSDIQALEESLESAKTAVSKVIVQAVEKGSRKDRETAGQALADLYETQEVLGGIKTWMNYEQGFSDVLEHFG